MAEFLIIMSIFLMGFFTGEAVAMFKVRKVILKLAKAAGIDVQGEIEKLNEENETAVKVPKLVTEVHSDIIYLYEKDTDTFICQGKTINELAQLAKDHKQILTAIVLHGNTIFAFKDGLSHEIIELK